MVAKLEGPQFSGGANIAIKCPSHTYEQTVSFYRDTLGLPLIEEEKDGCIFQFGPNRLWIDSVPNLSHPDIWLTQVRDTDRKSTRLNSSHRTISYAVFCLKKKKKKKKTTNQLPSNNN